VNIRIIAATNRDLEDAVEAGEFREDLYFRLNVIRITIPPLRERPEDIPLLVDHFVNKYNTELGVNCPGFGQDALEGMGGQSWRGNVRELENVVERALIFAGEKQVQLQDLPFAPSTDGAAGLFSEDLRAASREFERQHILKVLARYEENKVAAATALGIGLSSLYRKLEELDVGKGNRATSESTKPATS
jgi:DNA-binding NtrC family response regulator